MDVVCTLPFFQCHCGHRWTHTKPQSGRSVSWCPIKRGHMAIYGSWMDQGGWVGECSGVISGMWLDDLTKTDKMWVQLLTPTGCFLPPYVLTWGGGMDNPTAQASSYQAPDETLRAHDTIANLVNTPGTVLPSSRTLSTSGVQVPWAAPKDPCTRRLWEDSSLRRRFVCVQYVYVM